MLSYARGQQFDLLHALGFEAPSWQDLATLLILVLCSVALAGAAWAWWDRRRQDPWQRLQARIQQRLQAAGVGVLLHHPPRTRAALVRAAWGERGRATADLLDELDRRRYADGPGERLPDRGWWRRFDRAARAAQPSGGAQGTADNPA